MIYMSHNEVGLLKSNGQIEKYGSTAGGGGGGSSTGLTATYDETPALYAHSVDDIIYYNDHLYKVTSAISVGDTLSTSTNISTDTGIEANTPVYISNIPY